MDPAACTVYADTYFDLLALERVGHPVAVYPEPRLAAVTAERGWQVVGATRENDFSRYYESTITCGTNSPRRAR